MVSMRIAGSLESVSVEDSIIECQGDFLLIVAELEQSRRAGGSPVIKAGEHGLYRRSSLLVVQPGQGGLVSRSPDLGVEPEMIPVGHADERQGGTDGCGRRNRLPRMAARPFQRAPQGADLPGMDRVAALESPEIFGKLECRGVVLERRLLEAFQADGFEIARNPRLKARWRDDVGVDELMIDELGRFRPKWRPAGQGFVKDRA